MNTERMTGVKVSSVGQNACVVTADIIDPIEIGAHSNRAETSDDLSVIDNPF